MGSGSKDEFEEKTCSGQNKLFEQHDRLLIFSPVECR